jgi:hypothetical protein
MGQIISLPPTSAAYPQAAARLGRAACVLRLAVRWRVTDFKPRADPLPRLRETMATAGARVAAFAVDQLIGVIARSARRPMTILCPRCSGLSDLLGAASLAQAGDSQMAERSLRAALLSAPGAEFALVPLQEVVALFSDAQLFFRRRRLHDAGRAADGAAESRILRAVH